jgi:protein-glutamine gamma-glutamyltransferase
MKMPIALLGLSALFWGWQTGFWIVAIPIALVLEGRALIRWRWALTETDFRRFFNFCCIFLLVLAIYHWITDQSLSIVYFFVQVLPCSFFPLAFAQAYAANPCINFRTFFVSQRKLKVHKNIDFHSFDLHYPYFALCILSASTANAKETGFYIGMVALAAGLLWSIRPKRSSLALWLGLIFMAVSIGFVGHIGLHQLQATVEQKAAPWLGGIDGQSVNPYQASTRIGTIGNLKQSNAIVFRVDASDRQAFPSLLREATYNKYQSSAWVAVKSQFIPVQPTPEGTTWKFGEAPEPSSSIVISAQLDRGQGLLRLPDGASSVEQLPVEKMTRNQYGAVKVEGKSDAIAYRVQFNPALSLESPPTDSDLEIPETEQPAIQQTLQKLHLDGKSSSQTLDQVSSFFENNFQYSLKLTHTNQAITPLTEFLTKNYSGHCEYFATATTLLLRAAGIPARYATGYSVHEFSPLEHQYIVRSRNAHAWTMAYINGTWRSFDTTPPSWTAQEDANASSWQWVSDLWAFLSFKASAVLQSSTKKSFYWIGLAIAPVFLFALWFFRRKSRSSRVQRQSKAAIAPKPAFQNPSPGLDSEFYAIEKVLIEAGINRLPSESLPHWFKRLEDHLHTSLLETLKSILELHYRYRFDPMAMNAAERAKLNALSQTWLHTYHQSLSAKSVNVSP